MTTPRLPQVVLTLLGLVVQHAVTATVQQATLAGHNAARRAEAKAKHATNLYELVWDEDLAQGAARWASNCKMVHQAPSINVGENIYAASLTTLSEDHYVQEAIDRWMREKNLNADGSFDCCFGSHFTCCHYTQVVASSSRRVGCAVQVCPQLRDESNSVIQQNAVLVICNYSPAGNLAVMGHHEAYATGILCSACDRGDTCHDALCVTSEVQTTTPPCVDAISNCDSYEEGTCSNPDYRAWAEINCRLYCRLCPADQLPPLTTLSPENCVDKVDCRLYGMRVCTDPQYHAWAKINCMNFCQLCTGVPTTPKPCEDTIPNCHEYEDDMCSNPSYDVFVDDHCRAFCGRCNGGATTPTPCRDAITNCDEYPMGTCTNPAYDHWVEENCRVTCGRCTGGATTPRPCRDAITNCDEYPISTCTNPTYDSWVEENCRVTCGRCTVAGHSQPLLG